MNGKHRLQQLKARLFVQSQRLLPTHALSLLIHHLAQVRTPRVKNALIRSFLRFYPVDLQEALWEDPERYEHFNAFFTRPLKPGARPLDPDPTALLSPADGTISQFGTIEQGQIIQAKGMHYSAADLLGDAALAAPFDGGGFCTIYLAPHNYHRVHMPATGMLRSWNYVPGRLFSVNATTAGLMPRLFARNERVCAIFDTVCGPMAIVLVGALLVGGIETVWSGPITPPHGGEARQYEPAGTVQLNRGDELGRFNMGSTVILLTAPGRIGWAETLAPQRPLRMGEALGHQRR